MYELVLKLLKDKDNYQEKDEIVALWNEYASENNHDDYIYQSLDEIAEMYESPIEFARCVYFGDIQAWNDDYFCYNGYGNIVSFCGVNQVNSPIDWELLAEYVIDNEKFDDLEMIVTFDDLADDEKQAAFQAFNDEQHFTYYDLDNNVNYDDFVNNYADDYLYYPNGAIFERA